MPKFKTFKCDILSNFQTMWNSKETIFAFLLEMKRWFWSLFSGNSLSTLCRDTYCLRRLWTSNSRRRSCALTRDRLFQAWKSTKVFMENREAASASSTGRRSSKIQGGLLKLLNVPNPNSKTNSSKLFFNGFSNLVKTNKWFKIKKVSICHQISQ